MVNGGRWGLPCMEGAGELTLVAQQEVQDGIKLKVRRTQNTHMGT